MKLNIVEQPGFDIEIGEFRKYVRSHLEMRKVPTRIEKVPEIPGTANGKINRKALK